MARLTTYITKENDRWDLISYLAYGDPYRYIEIIEQNPGLSVYDVIPSGTKILIPISESVKLDNQDLPPWKR